MIRINLLPYRPERTQKQILRHLACLFGAVAAVSLLLIGLNMHANGKLTDLEDEHSQLKARNTVLQKKIGKIRNLDTLRAEVERKLDLVDELQQGRFESLITLHALAKVIPENVWLTSIEDNSGQLKFSGYGESNKAVANFMRALDQSSIFENVDLQVIERKKVSDTPVRSFGMTLNRSAQVDKKDEGKSRQGGKP